MLSQWSKLEKISGGSKLHRKFSLGHCLHYPHLSLLFLKKEQEGKQGSREVFEETKTVKVLQNLLGAGGYLYWIT